jgi:hypothetical protein
MQKKETLVNVLFSYPDAPYHQLACEKKTLVNVIFSYHVPAFHLISILCELKTIPEFNMEHPDLHPYYVFISFFDTGIHLRKKLQGSSCFCIAYSNI